MSLKIFALQLTGKIKSVDKVENQRLADEKNYKLFLEAEKSQKLAEFRELESWINSGAMQAAKKEIESMVFKGSIEYNQLKEFESLRKTKAIRNYFKIAGGNELNRFQRIKESDKLQEYFDLKDYVEGGVFQRDKHEIEANKFSGSVEERHLNELAKLKKSKALKDYLALKGSQALTRHLKFVESAKMHRFLELKNMPVKEKDARIEFKKLKNDPEIREFFRFEKSTQLKHFNEINGSHIPDRNQELLTETSTPEFQKKVSWLKDSKKLEKSEAWKKYMHYKRVASDPDIKFFLKFEKSPLYLNYLDTHDSFSLQRYNELLALTTSPEFLKRKAWLEDTKKWEKSEEYAKYQRFLELKKDPLIVHYFKYVNSSDFDFLKNWEVSFFDNFDSKSLDYSKWTPNSLWADRLLGDNFSQPGDLQAYTGGKNTMVSHGKLHIQVRKEKFRSRFWQPHTGFMANDYAYTSDTLSTIRSFWQEGGIFEAKILFNPVREVVSSCYLQGEKNSPVLALLEMGPVCRMGILSRDGEGKPKFDGVEINNLKKNLSYIFGLEWDGSKLIWRINGAVVHETYRAAIEGTAHLNLTSLVVQEIPGSHLPVNFEVDWIKCYRKR